MSPAEVESEAHLAIGRFARLTGISARTLRKYDALGILCPAAIDPDTRYRSYALSQYPRAQTIRMLRSLDVPLTEIAQIIAAEDPASARQRLERQLERVQERLAHDRHTLLRLESLVERGGPLGGYHCELREVVATPVIGLRFRTPRDAVNAAIAAARARLAAFASARSLPIVGREIVVYDFDPFEDDDYRGDVCQPLAGPAVGGGEIGAWTLPACTAAATIHRGPDDDLQGAYCALVDWIREQGLRIAGPEREIYHADERDSDDPRDHVTEVLWPVAPVTP